MSLSAFLQLLLVLAAMSGAAYYMVRQYRKDPPEL
jgi:hypothetical protein